MTRRLLDRLSVGRPETSPSQDGALSSLSHREVEVLSGITKRRSNLEIAHDLNLADATVGSHVSRILTEPGLSNRVQAALLADERRL